MKVMDQGSTVDITTSFALEDLGKHIALSLDYMEIEDLVQHIINNSDEQEPLIYGLVDLLENNVNTYAYLKELKND